MKKRVFEFTNTFHLVIANTWFMKTRNQRITSKSGNSESQIDYILTNPIHMKDIIKCKTIPSEAVVSQHRLVEMDLRTSTKKKTHIGERTKTRSNGGDLRIKQ